jgi:uncharacterized repeat protein (TIGR02543 family)
MTIDSRIKTIDTDIDVMENFNRVLKLYDTVAESVADLEDSQLFKVIFDSDGGSEVANQYIIEGDKVEEPTDPTKEDYTFVKWMNGEEEYDFDEPVTGHLSLKATWEADTPAAE